MIKSRFLKPLRLMAFSQVMKNLKSFLETRTDLAELGLAEVKTEFDAAFSALENALVQVRKNEQTEILLEIDQQRDRLFSSFLEHCKVFQNHPETEKSQAAKRSVIRIEAYGKKIQRRAYRDQTAIIRTIIQDFEKSDADKDLRLIGARQWLTLLDPINESFDKLYNQRTLAESEKEIGKNTEARAQMQEKFDRLCKAIEAMAFIKGEEKYLPLANAINKEVKDALSQSRHKNQPQTP